MASTRAPDRYPATMHAESGPTTLWTRVNAEEATPGVLTPLHWDFYRISSERAMRAGFYDRGVIRRSEIEPPGDADGRLIDVFFGRVAINVDVLRGWYDRIPGTSADEFEAAYLGAVRPDAVSEPTRRRHLVIRARQPLLARRIGRRMAELHASVHEWWRASVSPRARADVDGAPARWRHARDELERTMRLHAAAGYFAGDAFAALARACAQVGRPELLMRLSGGYGDTEDDRVSAGLWEVAHGRASLESFLDEHGFQGHRAGDLAARVWREQPEQLSPTLDAMATMDEDQAPAEVGRRRAAEREATEAELLGLTERRARDAVSRAIEDARRFTVLRELGKVTFQMTVDVGRAASRTLGEDLDRRALLAEPDDVFFLLADELLDGPVPDARERVEARRARHAENERLELPLTWIGAPDPVVAGPSAGTPEPATVSGIGVSPGRVEGTARVILDPTVGDPLEPGEVLVCPTTDPSWVGHFLVASGVVIDVGGPMSHGAIVARELGVPCVINTRAGTSRLRTGDRIRLDGDAGTVEVLERLAPPP